MRKHHQHTWFLPISYREKQRKETLEGIRIVAEVLQDTHKKYAFSSRAARNEAAENNPEKSFLSSYKLIRKSEINDCIIHKSQPILNKLVSHNAISRNYWTMLVTLLWKILKCKTGIFKQVTSDKHYKSGWPKCIICKESH